MDGQTKKQVHKAMNVLLIRSKIFCNVSVVQSIMSTVQTIHLHLIAKAIASISLYVQLDVVQNFCNHKKINNSGQRSPIDPIFELDLSWVLVNVP